MFGSASHDAARSGQAQHTGATKVKISRSEHHELVKQLSTFDAFAKCTRDDLDALVDAGKPFTLPANWALMAEGSCADSFYAITRGEARVYRGRVRIADVGAGAVVGEMGLLSGTNRQATVTSSSRLAGLRVGNDAVIELFAHHPRLLEALRGTRAARLAAERNAAP